MPFSQFHDYLQTITPLTWCSSRLEELFINALRQGPVPQHVAFVLDGNRRFAKKHDISISQGHARGAEITKKNLETCFKCGIRVLTLYLFSIENFKRPKPQVDALMELIKYFFYETSKPGGLLDRNGAHLRVSGRLELLEPDMISAIKHATELSKDYGDKVLNICLSYTSRDEIADAIRQTVVDCETPIQANKSRSEFIRDSSVVAPGSDVSRCEDSGIKPENEIQSMVLTPQDITSETLTNRMMTAGDPPLDFLIRTSGAQRLSDFMLWQGHQETLILFRNTLLPDYGFLQVYSTVREWQQGKHELVTEHKKWRPISQCFNSVFHKVPAIVKSRRRTCESIQKDVKSLSRLPEHLSVILPLGGGDDAVEVLMDQVAKLTAWSACAGIATISVFEEKGTLKSCIPMLHQVVTSKLALYYGSSTEQPIVGVSAPHHGIYSPSSTWSASEKSTLTGINLHLLSASDGRETIVDLTRSLAEMTQSGKLLADDINIEFVDAKLCDIISPPPNPIPAIKINDGISHSRSSSKNQALLSTSFGSIKPEPDFLIIPGPYFKLDGYPPWQIRLTEMFCTGGSGSSNKVVKYRAFIRGLYQYAGAEMRFGR